MTKLTKIIEILEKIFQIKFIFIFGFLYLLFYSFYPILSYQEDLEKSPWRIFITDRNWIVITDKAKSFGYFEKFAFSNFEKEKESLFVESLLKIEDKNFFSNYWVDFLAKTRAIKENLENKKVVSWWSTITEQFVKNKYFRSEKRNIMQKTRESILALYFSLIYDKKEVLENYLNNVYFWNQIYWIKGSLEIYFGKTKIEDLKKEEIVLLISLLHNPWLNSEKKAFREYFKLVKNRLWFEFDDEKFLSSLVPKKKKNIDKFPFVSREIFSNKNLVLEEKDWKIKSTIDSNLSNFASTKIKETIFSLKQKNVTNWAIFAINPKNNQILIYEWSKDFYGKDWQVNVIKALRQPWSTMKPFLYLLALQNWANTDDLIVDLENSYDSFKQDKTYISQNYSLKEYWLVRFKKALWNSLNNASVRLASHLWLEKVYDFYKKSWFILKENPEFYGYSLVLGNPSISLENLVYSYKTLVPDWNIDKTLLYEVLKNPDNRDLSFWVKSILNTSILQAVKTWTSSDFKDNLVVSYSPDLVIWVWVWNNDNSSMIWVSWITWAGSLWHFVTEKAIELWYIKEEKNFLETLQKDFYCLDEKCFRKEIIYKKDQKKYFSRIADNLYSRKDLFENLSEQEEKKLRELWFYLK